MLRLLFSALFLTACLGGTKAVAQQKPAPATPSQPAAPAAEQSAAPVPAPQQRAPVADNPPATWVAAAAYIDESESDPVSRSSGQQIAPGFTASPTHRVMTDYQNRPVKPFKRVKRIETPAATPAPAPPTNTMGNQTTPAAPTPAPAPPAKETQSGGSDW